MRLFGTRWRREEDAGVVSLNHLVRSQQQRWRDRQAEGLGSLEVDHQLELRRLLNGEVGGLSTFEDLVHVACGTAEIVGEFRAVAHQAAPCDMFQIKEY